MSANPTSSIENKLRETLSNDPADWETRKQLAHHLYDQGSFQAAADTVWDAEAIPSIDVELAFAARVLAKASPRKAIRLLTALLELNHGKAVQNLGLANALLHHGMVLQAARFYGAAMEADPTLGNPDLEHFILWTDDEETLWGDFKDRKPKLGDLPWMKRDPKEAMKLTSRINLHTTPIVLPSLKPAAGEELNNELYQQTAEKGAQPSPPPAVTIPLDRVDPQYRLFDSELGAPNAPEAPQKAPVKAAEPVPAAEPVEDPVAEPVAVVVPTKALPPMSDKPAAPNPTVTPPPKPAATVGLPPMKPMAGPPTVRLKPTLPPIAPKSS